MSIHKAFQLIYEGHCKHGQDWSGKYCLKCMEEKFADQRAQAAALQTMHDLLVIAACGGLEISMSVNLPKDGRRVRRFWP